jgi:predicted ATP-grasp superfamily ATP-dependent carboligase
VRIHVFEFIGGGGLAGSPVPARLLREGDRMLSALVADLLELPGVQVSYARDARFAPLGDPRLGEAQVHWRGAFEAPSQALAREIAAADATWPIAPETGGELERAARTVIDARRLLLGAHPDAIRVAGSKVATAQRLQQAAVAVAPCCRLGQPWPPIEGPWVVKPDDGAGCIDTRVWPGAGEAAAALGHGGAGLIAQPWIAGEAMSLCALAAHGQVQVLSVNRQYLDLTDGAIELAGLEVNCGPVTAPLAALAERVFAAIPGLAGYFGIDYVQAATGPVVIEVNPRLTSSYAGLRAALGLNVAEYVLAAANGQPLPVRSGHPGRPIRLTFDGHALR